MKTRSVVSTTWPIPFLLILPSRAKSHPKDSGDDDAGTPSDSRGRDDGKPAVTTGFVSNQAETGPPFKPARP
jgi:hypothetical protein